MWNDHWSIIKPAYFIIWFSIKINFRFSKNWCSRAQKGANMWSTPAVWKQYNKMAVLHFFLVNSTLIYILFSLTGSLILSDPSFKDDNRTCPIYNCNFKSFVWSRMNWISFFLLLQHFSCFQEAMEKLTEINAFRVFKNYSIFHKFDQIKVSRLPL